MRVAHGSRRAAERAWAGQGGGCSHGVGRCGCDEPRGSRRQARRVRHRRAEAHAGRDGTVARWRPCYGVALRRSNGMADSVSQFATRLAYGARQLPRVAWYIGHGLVMRRLSQTVRERAGQSPRPQARVPVPDRARLYADIAVLFQRDLANVEAGIYPLPADHDGTLPVLLARSRLFFEDLPEVHHRRERREVRQVLTAHARQASQLLPAEFPLPVGRLADGGVGAAL